VLRTALQPGATGSFPQEEEGQAGLGVASQTGSRINRPSSDYFVSAGAAGTAGTAGAAGAAGALLVLAAAGAAGATGAADDLHFPQHVLQPTPTIIAANPITATNTIRFITPSPFCGSPVNHYALQTASDFA